MRAPGARSLKRGSFLISGVQIGGSMKRWRTASERSAAAVNAGR